MSVIVAITGVTLVHVQGDDGCVAHVLGDSTLFPADTEQFVEGLQGCRFSAFYHLWWYAVTAWDFSVRECVYGFAQLLNGGLSIQFVRHGQVFSGTEGLLGDRSLSGIEL